MSRDPDKAFREAFDALPSVTAKQLRSGDLIYLDGRYGGLFRVIKVTPTGKICATQLDPKDLHELWKTTIAPTREERVFVENAVQRQGQQRGFYDVVKVPVLFKRMTMDVIRMSSGYEGS